MKCGVCDSDIEPGELHCPSCSALVQSDFLDEEMIVNDDFF